MSKLVLACLAACSSSSKQTAVEAEPAVSDVPISPSFDAMPSMILRATLVPHSLQIMVGEPVYVTHRLFNEGDTPLQFREGGNQRNRLGRFDDYNLRILREDGRVLPAVDSNPNFGGRSWVPTIADNESFVHELFLPHWGEFLEPGTYTIHSERTYSTRAVAADHWSGDGGTEVTVSAKATITVIPASVEVMGQRIAELGREMFTSVESDARTQAWQKMGSIADPRVIPHYRKAIASKQYSLVSSALTALANFKEDAALTCMEGAMKLRGPDLVGEFARPELAESSADNLRQHAAQSLSSSPHPKAFALLLTMSADSYQGVRLTVLHAIASKRPKDARKRIAAFTKDPSEMVSGEAQRYLREF